MDLRDIINSIYPISEKSMDRVLSCSLELGHPKGASPIGGRENRVGYILYKKRNCEGLCFARR